MPVDVAVVLLSLIFGLAISIRFATKRKYDWAKLFSVPDPVPCDGLSGSLGNRKQRFKKRWSFKILMFSSAYFGMMFVEFSDGNILHLIVCVGCATVAVVIDRRHKSSFQTSYDDETEEILKALARGEKTRNFALYVRPFEIAKKVPINLDERGEGVYWPNPNTENTQDLELLLSRVLGEDLPLVGLRESHASGEGALGAGRVSSLDSEWESDFRRFAHHCDVIFIVPSMRSHVLWEISEIFREGYVGKSVFVLPPQNEFELITKNTWNQLEGFFCDKGVQLPCYCRDGLLFVYSDRFELVARIGLGQSLQSEEFLNKIRLALRQIDLNSSERRIDTKEQTRK